MIQFEPVKKVVFSPIEAAQYLGLDCDGADEEKMLRRLKRLVDEKQAIRPMRFMKTRLYHIAELDRFLREQSDCELLAD